MKTSLPPASVAVSARIHKMNMRSTDLFEVVCVPVDCVKKSVRSASYVSTSMYFSCAAMHPETATDIGLLDFAGV